VTLPYRVQAIFRVVAALERAEQEHPHLAAPDGTVAVQIEDLRALVDQLDEQRDTLALGRSFWRERWYGSAPERGSSIVTERGATVAYLGGNEETHDEVRKVVAAHNAALNAVQPA
jgi:hypothetical protein